MQTRLTGGAIYDQAVYNETSGLFTYTNIVPPGGNVEYNGDFSLPGETVVVDSGCKSSVSVFTIDYDAPLGQNQTAIRKALTPLVQFEKGSGSGYGNWGNGGWPGNHHWTGRDASGASV